MTTFNAAFGVTMIACLRCGRYDGRPIFNPRPPIPILCAQCIRPDDIWFSLRGPVASKKNRRRWVRRGHRKFLVPSQAAVEDAAMIREAAQDYLDLYSAKRFERGIAVRLDYCHDERDDSVHVLVSREDGEPSAARSDVHGMLETIADALQGVAYDDDHQLVAGSFLRIRDNRPKAQDGPTKPTRRRK